MKTTALITVLVALNAFIPSLEAEIVVKTGEKVAFLGDSITASGYSNAGGYVQLIGAAMAANGVKIELIGAGWSGHKSDQMLARLERDVLSKKPQWMALSCGVNDVWHGPKGISLPEYQKNITSIVEQAQAAGIKVVILTSTMITEDASSPNNLKLADYNAFLRTLATEKKCLLADLNSDMQAALSEFKKSAPSPAPKNLITTDGVHMAYVGDMMMATGVLKAFGLDSTELAKAKAFWLDLPKTNVFEFKVALTQRQTEELGKLAAKQGMMVKQLLEKTINEQANSFTESARQ